MQDSNDPIVFSLHIPRVHVYQIMGRQGKNAIAIEESTKCTISSGQDAAAPAGFHTIAFSAPNVPSMIDGCEEFLKLVFKAQKERKTKYNKDLATLLNNMNIRERLNLLQNFGVTFTLELAAIVTIKAWNKLSINDFFTQFESALQDRDSIKSGTEPVKKPQAKTVVHVGMDCSKYPKCMNILVLGETGVGKSTFINSLVNHMKFGSIEEAIESEPEILIESEFTLMDDHFESKIIRVHPPDRNVTGQKQTSNEVFGPGKSATQKPKAYLFEYTHNGVDKAIRIIDTPGIGDTRGIEFDKENFHNILSFIAEYRDLHAICILMKPNNARETLAFRICIDELLVHLHKNASRNLLFCFTNTRGTLYKPGDTFPTLKEHLAKLQKDRAISIPLKKETLFSFDNESFRFLCALKQGFNFDEKEQENFSASWTKSVEETARLFDCISALPVHNTNDTLCLNNTRQMILALADPLAQMVRTNLTNQKLMEERIEEVDRLSKNGQLLQGSLYKDQVVLEPEEIHYPMTVCCSSKNCVDHKRIGTASSAPLETIYKTECHTHCYLEGVQTETVLNAILQGCWCMRSEAGDIFCRLCKCSWNTHMHIRYKMNSRMKKVIDKQTQDELRLHGDKVKTAEDFIAKLKSDIVDLQQEHKMITNYGAVFAAFLAENSILPYNDSYLDNVNHLIKEERNKAEISRNDDLVVQMVKYRDAYQEQVNLIRANIDHKAENVRSVEEIHKMVSELKSLTHAGRVILKVQDLEVRSIRQTKQNTETRISAGNWFEHADSTALGELECSWLDGPDSDHTEPSTSESHHSWFGLSAFKRFKEYLFGVQLALEAF